MEKKTKIIQNKESRHMETRPVKQNRVRHGNGPVASVMVRAALAERVCPPMDCHPAAITIATELVSPATIRSDTS